MKIILSTALSVSLLVASSATYSQLGYSAEDIQKIHQHLKNSQNDDVFDSQTNAIKKRAEKARRAQMNAELKRNKGQIVKQETKKPRKKLTPEQQEAERKKQEAIREENRQYAISNWEQARPILGTADAIPFLIEAAKYKHPAATYQLALAYLEGKGVYANYRQAEILMGDAARLKHPLAQFILGNMLKLKAQSDYNPDHIYIWIPAAYAWYSVP